MWRLSIVYMYLLCLVFCVPWTDTVSFKMDHRKVNGNGLYLPFYGYSIISMCEMTPKLAELFAVFNSSRIAEFFKPLPLDSYHMTVYNIWNEYEQFYPYMIKLANGETPKKDADYMDQLMKPVLQQMADTIQKYPRLEKMRLTNGTVVINSNSITIHVDIEDSRQNSDLQSIRQWYGERYDKSNSSLRFHVTLGYLYRAIFRNLEVDIAKLQTWVDENLANFTITKPAPMYFPSMEKFIPYTQIIKK